ncbi:MAG TPA: hypothetical protein VKA70_18530 [Blastocatellia bacterium]|nr:hypothetical protein [Blastocatellia bacterium]
MNQEREEERIKELFHELKREDERRAPAFARVMGAARSTSFKTRRPLRVLTIAVAAALLVLAVASLLVIRQLTTKTAPVERVETEEPPAPSSQPAVIADNPDKSRAPDERRATKQSRRRVARRAPESATLISGWRSPTDFLLNTPGQQLLRTTPRLGESIVDIEEFFPEERK